MGIIGLESSKSYERGCYGMYDIESVRRKLEELEKERDRIIEEFRRLEEKRNSGAITEDEYREERYKLERRAVEVMDRIAQLRFMAGYV